VLPCGWATITYRHPLADLLMQRSAFPDTFQTARLALRRPEAEDARAMFDSYTQDADVARYMVWRPHASFENTRDFVARCVAEWIAGSERAYVITDRTHGQLIGMLAVRHHGHVVNIGYVLTRSRWGQGLMVEAVQTFAAIALGVPEVFRIEATCDVDHRPSARVLEKSGFLREGRLARHTVHPNISAEPRDCFMYALCRP
jgi:RimJ/RimL family protein N-acetyltransferase